MFFYTALFIACTVIALLLFYVFNSLLDVGKLVYRAFLPSAKTNFTSRPAERKLATTVNDTPTPWGWQSHTSPDHVARTHTATSPGKTPWGWRGNHQAVREHHTGKRDGTASPNQRDSTAKSPETVISTVGWPYREEKFEFAGKAYKVMRKTTPKPTNLKTTSKPWGW